MDLNAGDLGLTTRVS